MASTSRTLSPGGTLLRASRMFSLPSAIPPPPGDHQAATSYHSNTATAPFPTLQTVTAPESFRQRGDWGFKRNFPLRSTARTSTPYLRIKQVDSSEHVTDFASAADHTLSLEKWQEMNIAISLPHATDSITQSYAKNFDNALESVFEEKYDFTAIDSAKIDAAGHRRWKYKGPWLANLTEGEFQTFVKREVRGRRLEFRVFLCRHLASEQTAAARQRAMDQAEDVDVPEVRPEDITDEQVLQFFRIARVHRDKLYDLVSKFLDLAPIEPPPGVEMNHLGRMQPMESKVVDRANPYAQFGPPITHPSAGLSYLRTNSFLENHPIYGPQQKHAPVKARVLTIAASDPRIAAGGFVTQSKMARSAYRESAMSKNNHNNPGGPKMWVNIVSAQVDSNGRAMINVEEAGASERMVQEEMLGEKQVYHAQPTERVLEQRMRGPSSSRALRDRNYSFKVSDSGSYGADWSRKN